MDRKTTQIVIREHENHGTYDAFVNGEPLCRSRTPLLTSARILLQRGMDPNTRLEMRREGSSSVDMAATLLGAANLMVKEKVRGSAPQFRKFQLYEGPGD